MGKLSRDRGKRFERRCVKLLPTLLDHPHWKRTQRGDTQRRGDIVACDKDGTEIAELLDKYYIECKYRESYTVRDVRRWADEAMAMGHYAEHVWLLFGQHRGPVFAMYCQKNDMEYGMLRVFMLGNKESK